MDMHHIQEGEQLLSHLGSRKSNTKLDRKLHRVLEQLLRDVRARQALAKRYKAMQLVMLEAASDVGRAFAMLDSPGGCLACGEASTLLDTVRLRLVHAAGGNENGAATGQGSGNPDNRR